MSHNEKNSNSVGTQQNQPEDSFDLNKTMQNLPNSDIANDPKKLKERITDLLKGDKILAVSAASGLFTAVLPLLAVGATLAIPGAIVGLALYCAVKVAVKTVQSGYKGLKWSAEKTVDGAKYTAGKVRDGAVHVKDKVKEGYEHSVDSLKKGASFVGEGVANKFHKASGETDYLDKVKRFTPDAIKKSDEIRNDMKAIFADKGNNSGLVKNVLSGISSEIDLKMAEKAKSGEIEHTSGWQVQKEFINNLNEKSLHNLLTQRSLPKGSYFIDSVFSEHYDEMKEVIAKCKEDHILKGSLKMSSNMFEEGSAKPSRSLSFSLLGRKNSEQSNSLSRSNSLNSVKTDSTVSSEAELLNPAEHKEVKAPSSFGEKMPSWLGDKKAPKETTNVKYQVLSESDTLSRKIGNSTFYVAPPKPLRSNSLNSIGTESTATVSDSDSQNFATVSRGNSFNSLNASPKLTPVAPPKPPRSPSIDSGRGSSGSSTPHGLDYLSFPDDLRNTSAKLQKQGYFGGQARQQATRTLREKQDYVVMDMEGYTDSIGYQSGSDNGRSSPGSSAHSTPTRQGLPSKEQFDKKLGEKLAKRRAVLDGVSLKSITQKVTTV